MYFGHFPVRVKFRNHMCKPGGQGLHCIAPLLNGSYIGFQNSVWKTGATLRHPTRKIVSVQYIDVVNVFLQSLMIF